MDDIKVFQSVAALANYIKLGTPSGVFSNEDEIFLASEDYDAEFSGTANLGEALKLLKYGWADGAARVRGFMADGGNFESIGEPEIIPGVVGFCPNVPAYIAGVPQNMLQMEYPPTDRQITTIVYNSAVGFDIEAGKIEKTAARLFNVVAGLEARGVGVELWAVDLSKCGDDVKALGVKIKSAGDSFNILNAVFSCVHPSFCRRIGFRSVEIAGFDNPKWLIGYGTAVIDGPGQNELLKKMGLDCKNVFNYYNLSGKTEKEILAMIK